MGVHCRAPNLLAFTGYSVPEHVARLPSQTRTTKTNTSSSYLPLTTIVPSPCLFMPLHASACLFTPLHAPGESVTTTYFTTACSSFSGVQWVATRSLFR